MNKHLIVAAMAQQVEHVLGKDEVTGSNPVSSSNYTPLQNSNGVFFYQKANTPKNLYLPFLFIS